MPAAWAVFGVLAVCNALGVAAVLVAARKGARVWMLATACVAVAVGVFLARIAFTDCT